MKKNPAKPPFIPQTVWPDLGSYVRVKARCSFEVVSAMGGKFDDPCSTKAPSPSVFKGSLARNGCPETSRATLSSLLASQIALVVARCSFSDRPLSLQCGAHFQRARAAQACRIALIAVRCSFSARSRSPGLSDRSHCGAVLIFSALVQPRLVGSLSLRCGAHFQRALATHSALWACQITLVVVRCSFW